MLRDWQDKEDDGSIHPYAELALYGLGILALVAAPFVFAAL